MSDDQFDPATLPSRWTRLSPEPTLTDWLLEQIAADEAVARRVQSTPPSAVALLWGAVFPSPTNRTAFDPAHVLAVCGAHRRILDLHSDSAPFCDSHVDHGMTHRDAYDAYPQQREWCDTLRALAVAYADRPGFRGEWR